MSGCGNGARPGCSGVLCRSARMVLRRLTVRRYPKDEAGLPDTSAVPERGWVCAIVSRAPAEDMRLELPGIAGGGERPLRLLCAAGSFRAPLAVGDRVSIDGREWQVTGSMQGAYCTAELLPLD